jgi:hypothetical protein
MLKSGRIIMKILDMQNAKKNLHLVNCIFLFCYLTIYTLYASVFYVEITNAYESSNWPCTIGKVVVAADSRQVKNSLSEGSVWYEFCVNNHTYRGSRLSFFGESKIWQYKTNDKVNVFYQAESPTNSCLLKGVSSTTLLHAGLWFIGLFAGAIILGKMICEWPNVQPAMKVKSSYKPVHRWNLFGRFCRYIEDYLEVW